jgi:hypothetical protein
MKNTRISNSANSPSPALKLDKNGVTLTMRRSTSLNHLEDALGIKPRSLAMHRISGTDSFRLVWNGFEVIDPVSLRVAGIIA